MLYTEAMASAAFNFRKSSSVTLVSAPHVEIENADRLTKPFWQYVSRYLCEQYNVVPGTNDCATLYFDTPKFDVFRAGVSLRDRPGGFASDGESFKDEFSVKCQHPGYTEYAKRLTQTLYPRQDMTGFMPYVRTEIESPHMNTHARGASEYRYFDFPPEIQAVLEDRIGSSCKNMVYKPQVVTYVERNRSSVLLNPQDAFNFIMPLTARPDQQARLDNYACVEIAMDKCVHRRPTPGLPINEILAASSSTAGRFTFLKADWLLEREFKSEVSGSLLTDEMMVAAYTRLGMFLRDLSMPFQGKNKEEPIRPVRSKAARGLEALVTKYPQLMPSDLPNVLHLVP